MNDLIEKTYKCHLTLCYKCEYYNECLLCEVLNDHTGNAPPIIDYPTPTQIIYAEGEEQTTNQRELESIGNNMHDLIEMTYKCHLTPVTDCPKCEYYKECVLSEILDVHTGKAPSIIDYPTPTQIIYAEGE